MGVMAQKGFDISVKLTEKGSKDPVMMATVVLDPSGAGTITDSQGNAVLKNIPEGQYTMVVSYVGFEALRLSVRVNKPLTLQLQMVD